MPLLRSETKELQSKLAKYVRDGNLPLIKGAKQDKLHHYRRLVYNIIFNSLSNAYPIASGLLGKENWKSLVDEFFINHNPQDPQIWSFPYELYEYIIKSDHAQRVGKLYLNDLIYFEWIEMEVYATEDLEINNFKITINNSEYILNPYIRILSFEYPVFRKEDKIEKMQKGNYFNICYRDLNDLKVYFIELDAFATIFLETLYENLDINIAINKVSELIKQKLNIENFIPLINNLESRVFINNS